MVTLNSNEIRFVELDQDKSTMFGVDHFIDFETGSLAIDEDFLNEVNGVFSSLYDATGVLHYGENPLVRLLDHYPLSNSLRTLKLPEASYYVYDMPLSKDGLEGLWLRGVVSVNQGEFEISKVITNSLLFLPILVVFAAVGGYWLAKSSLKPLETMSAAAKEISNTENLTKRIELDDRDDEVHQLAHSFNQMMEKLETSFKQQQQFTSDVSHELRTPMSVIMAQTEYTLEEERSTEEYLEALNTIKRQGQRMTRLINDMLQFTRLDSNSEKITMETIDLSKMLNSICEDMALLRVNDISLNYSLIDNVFIEGNYDLMTMAITNLINNAYRYGKAKGNIWVALSQEDNKVEISIKDDGRGMANEELEKIFERFYKTDDSRASTGTGLGLALVKSIIDFHKGSITVTSQLGVGTKFTIHLVSNENLILL